MSLVMVDSNEEATNPHIVGILRKYYPKLQVIALDFGDVNVILDDGAILAVERKNVGDFLSSVGDGRVFRQVEGMAAVAKFYCVIMVGELSFDVNDMAVADGRETNWRGKSVRGALHALQWSGCPVLFANGDEAYPLALQEAIEFCSKPAEHLQTIGHKRVVTFPPVELPVEILAAFPGIGIKRAQALLDFVSTTEYNSLGGALAWASVFPLIKQGGRPEGWGDKSVENFRALLGLKSNEYLQIRREGEPLTKKRS